ncbi:MAG: hypothetical protein HZB32_08170 [Nitrospirae bacterium]|nr:hypothetical protein [Nitrospirota bacterium]
MSIIWCSSCRRLLSFPVHAF